MTRTIIQAGIQATIYELVTKGAYIPLIVTILREVADEMEQEVIE